MTTLLLFTYRLFSFSSTLEFLSRSVLSEIALENMVILFVLLLFIWLDQSSLKWRWRIWLFFWAVLGVPRGLEI
jgi:hypothetical protein